MLVDFILLALLFSQSRLLLFLLLVLGGLRSQLLLGLLLLLSLHDSVYTAALHGHLKLMLGQRASHILERLVSVGKVDMLLLLGLLELCINLFISVFYLILGLLILGRHVLVELLVVFFSVLSLLLELLINKVVHLFFLGLLPAHGFVSYSFSLLTRLLLLLPLSLSFSLLFLFFGLCLLAPLHLGGLLLCQRHLLLQGHV